MLRQRVCFVAVFILAWLAFCEPWLSGTYTIPFDAKAHFQAQIQFLAHAIATGDSPFWTPNVFAGSPQIADPQSLIFSPAVLIALFTAEPSFLIVDAYVLALLGLGGLAVGWFALDRGWHPAGAMVTALAFSFGASAAWRIQHVGQIKSYVFFGVTLWLLARCIERRSIGWGILTGLSAAVMIAEPDQVALLGCYVLAGFVIHAWASANLPWMAVRETLPALAAAATVCIALAIFPLLFTLLFAEASNRATISLSEALSGSLHPASLLTSVVSDLFGAHSSGVPYWGPASAAWGEAGIALTQNMGQLYIGVLPVLVVLGIGLAGRRAFDKENRFFVIAIVLLVAYALGHHTPLFEAVFHRLPGVAVFRRPADATFLIGAVLSLQAGYLVHLWISGQGWPGTKIALPVLTVVIATLLGGCAILAARHARLDAAGSAILTSAIWLAAGIVILEALRRTRLASAPAGAGSLVAVVLIGSFMVADLRANNGPNESTALPAAQYDVLSTRATNETVKLLKSLIRQPGTRDRRPRVELTGLGFEWPNASLVQGFENVFGYNPLRLGDFNAATGSPDTISAPDQRRFTPIFPSYKSLFANMFCLRYIATGAPIELIDRSLRAGDLRFIARTKDAYVYENPNALPRVLFADGYREADFEALIRTGRWPDGFDPTREVLLEEVPEGIAAGLRGDDHGGYARLVSYKNTVVEVAVEARRPGFVVLNDVFHPWWRATVNGEDAPIFKANVLFRAVQVPAGTSVVRFEFKPVEGSIAEVAEMIWPAAE
jgi:hypothetical protein